MYLGGGVDPVLTGSADNLVPWLSGVAMAPLSAVERSEISSGVWVDSSISGVEPLLKRSGRETLPLSSGKGDNDAGVSGERGLFFSSGETGVSLDWDDNSVPLNEGKGDEWTALD